MIEIDGSVHVDGEIGDWDRKPDIVTYGAEGRRGREGAEGGATGPSEHVREQ